MMYHVRMIHEVDIQKLAALSRIELREEEKRSMLPDFEAILAYISEIETVDVKAEAALPSYSPLKNVMREDGEPHESGLYTDEILREAPRQTRNYIAVKKVLP